MIPVAINPAIPPGCAELRGSNGSVYVTNIGGAAMTESTARERALTAIDAAIEEGTVEALMPAALEGSRPRSVRGPHARPLRLQMGLGDHE